MRKEAEAEAAAQIAELDRQLKVRQCLCLGYTHLPLCSYNATTGTELLTMQNVNCQLRTIRTLLAFQFCSYSSMLLVYLRKRSLSFVFKQCSDLLTLLQKGTDRVVALFYVMLRYWLLLGFTLKFELRVYSDSVKPHHQVEFFSNCCGVVFVFPSWKIAMKKMKT